MKAAMAKITVVIADDHAIVRDGMKQLLNSSGKAEVVAEAENGVEAIAMVKSHQPGLLFLDLAMPYVGGLEVLGEINSWSPTTRIVVFTGIATAGVVSELMQAQVEGIIFKSCTTDEISNAVQDLLDGKSHICQDAMHLARKGGALYELTSRERQVLHGIVNGNSNADMARVFNISPKTVDNHRTNIMRKLDVHSESDLIRIALREGLTPPEFPPADLPSQQ
ncbi:MAG: response regulator [Halioglobus sp.]